MLVLQRINNPASFVRVGWLQRRMREENHANRQIQLIRHQFNSVTTTQRITTSLSNSRPYLKFERDFQLGGRQRHGPVDQDESDDGDYDGEVGKQNANACRKKTGSSENGKKE